MNNNNSKNTTGKSRNAAISIVKHNKKYKKKYDKKSEFILICCSVFFLLFASVICITNRASAKDNEYKYYTSITIEYGDTLWSIANQYMDKEHYTRTSYISEIKSINHIKDDYIQEGKLLILPYYSNEYKVSE